MPSIPCSQLSCEKNPRGGETPSLNEQLIFGDEAEPLGRTLIDKFDMVVTVCGLFAGLSSLGGHLLSLARHWAYMVRRRW